MAEYIMPISNEYRNSLCEVKSPQNELITTGTLGEVDELYLTIRDERKSLPMLSYKTSVKINIFNQDLGFKVLVGKVYISTREFMKISDIYNILDYERRQFFRIQIKLAGVLEMPVPQEEGDLEEPQIRQVQAKVLDLSLKGMLTLCEEPLRMGQEFVVVLRLNSTECRFKSVVRRIETSDRHPPRYGCEFLGVRDPEQRYLCMFLFQAQRQQINQRRNVLTNQ